MFFITGDVHGNWGRIADFCDRQHTTKEDVLIILGDSGINYTGGMKDSHGKRILSELEITLFCIHGNHELRVRHLPTYKPVQFCGATAYAEEAYPNILFAEDGQVYTINNKRCMVIGGAYSVDKYYRLDAGYHWWPDEQPDLAIKTAVSERIESENYSIDVFLTHTCPFKYIPREVFLPGIDQSTVDNSTEHWLDHLEELCCGYQAWYCGHFHTSKTVDKLHFMFEDYRVFE